MSTFRQKVQASTDWGKPDPADELPQRRQKAGKPQSGKRHSGTRAQITGHPQFPAFAALWLAALFGLGSLAISSQVLGALVTAIGLPALVPAAAPPLGFTAHLLVALLLTIVGGGLGLVIAMRLRPRKGAAPHSDAAIPAESDAENGGVPKVRARDAHPDAPPRRPLVLTEAFGEPSNTMIEEPFAPAVALLSDSLVGEPESWLPVYTPGGDGALPPLDLPPLDLPPLDLPPLDLPPLDLSELDAVEELPPFAPAFAGAGPFNPATAPFGEPAPAPVPTLLAATPQLPSGASLPMPSREALQAGEPWSPVATAPIESLGLVQLIERLALAIAARKADGHAGPTPPADGANPEVAEADIEAGAETGAEAGDEPAPGPFARIAPLAEGVDHVTTEEPLGSAREAIMRRLGAVAAPAPEVTDAVVTMRPASLPAKPFTAPVLAPALTQAPATAPVPFETDEALRSALATLQRMSARG